MMTSYRKAWKQGIGVVAVIGLAISVLNYPFVGVAGMFTVGAVMGAAVGWAVQIEERPGRLGRTAKISACSGLGILTVVGLTTLMGPAVYVVVIAAVGTSPQVITRLRKYASRSREATSGVQTTKHLADASGRTAKSSITHLDGPPDIGPLPTSPALLEDETLCMAWRSSHLLLQQSLPVDTRMLVVQLRQRYLDEMERRNPAGLSTWFASEALPSSDPSSYLTSRNESPPTDDGQVSP